MGTLPLHELRDAGGVLSGFTGTLLALLGSKAQTTLAGLELVSALAFNAALHSGFAAAVHHRGWTTLLCLFASQYRPPFVLPPSGRVQQGLAGVEDLPFWDMLACLL